MQAEARRLQIIEMLGKNGTGVVSVTLLAKHYDVLRKARRRGLKDEFRSKLGWLVGNLYSRIGTTDWCEPPERTRELEALVKEYLEPGNDTSGPIWVRKTWVDAAKGAGVMIEQLERDKISSTLEAHRPLPARDQILAAVRRVVKDIMKDVDDDVLRRIENRLSNDGPFAQAVKRAKFD